MSRCSAKLDGVKVHDANLTNVRGFYGRHKAEQMDVQGAEYARYATISRHWPWERIRYFGTIPLFGVSNLAVIGIVALSVFVDWYNAQVAALRDNDRISEVVPWVGGLREMYIPPVFGITLLAIVLLVFAAGIYKFGCPTIIREYTRSRWSLEQKNPLVQYLSLSHSRPVLRVLCALFYLLGGTWTIGYLAWRVLGALITIFASQFGELANPG